MKNTLNLKRLIIVSLATTTLFAGVSQASWGDDDHEHYMEKGYDYDDNHKRGHRNELKGKWGSRGKRGKWGSRGAMLAYAALRNIDELKLTPEQEQSLQDIINQTKEKFTKLREEHQTKKEQNSLNFAENFSKLMANENLSESDINQMHQARESEMLSMKTKMNTINTQSFLKTHKVLTSEQRIQLLKIMKKYKKRY